MNDRNAIAAVAPSRPMFREVCPVCMGQRYAERLSGLSQIGVDCGRCAMCAGTGYVLREVAQ